MTDVRATTITKWSDAGCPDWCDFAVSLQGELEAAYETTRAITADRDRARYEATTLRNALALRDEPYDIAEAEATITKQAQAIEAIEKARDAALLKNRNQRNEIRALNRKIDTINEYAAKGVFTYFHNNVTKMLDACARLLGCERFGVLDALRARLADAPVRPPTPTTLNGWKTGDACEVRLYCANLADTEWLPARVLRHHPDGTYAVETQGRTVRADVRDLRRPIQPSEPADGGNRQSDGRHVGWTQGDGRMYDGPGRVVTDKAEQDAIVARLGAAEPLEAVEEFAEPCAECAWCHGTRQSRNEWELVCQECAGDARTRREGFESLHRNRDRLAAEVQQLRTHWGSQDEVATLTRERDEATARIAELNESLDRCIERERDLREFEPLHADAWDVLAAHGVKRTGPLAEAVRAVVERATRAERTLQRVREARVMRLEPGESGWAAMQRVKAILDEESGR